MTPDQRNSKITFVLGDKGSHGGLSGADMMAVVAPTPFAGVAVAMGPLATSFRSVACAECADQERRLFPGRHEIGSSQRTAERLSADGRGSSTATLTREGIRATCSIPPFGGYTICAAVSTVNVETGVDSRPRAPPLLGVRTL